MKNLTMLISQRLFVIKSWSALLSVLILFLSFNSVYSDVVEVSEVSGNTIIPIQQNDIRMLKEVVKVNKTGMVDALFTLENTTDKNISFLIGFPFKKEQEPSSSQNIEFGATNTEGEFVAKINGEKATVKKEILNKYTKLKIDFEYDFIYAWRITFKPKEKKTVECLYPVLWSFARKIDPPRREFKDSREFTYITKTGALWQGTIKQADFYIDIDSGIPIEWIKQKKVKLDINPKGYKIMNYRTVEWHFENWKPTEDISITILQNK